MESVIVTVIVVLILTIVIINALVFEEIFIRITDKDYGIKDTFKRYKDLYKDKNILGKFYILIFSIVTMPSVILAFVAYFILGLLIFIWELGEKKEVKENE